MQSLRGPWRPALVLLYTVLEPEALPACVQVQDTIPIHAAHMSQQVALRSLRAGPRWLSDRIGELKQNR